MLKETPPPLKPCFWRGGGVRKAISCSDVTHGGHLFSPVLGFCTCASAGHRGFFRRTFRVLEGRWRKTPWSLKAVRLCCCSEPPTPQQPALPAFAVGGCGLSAFQLQNEQLISSKKAQCCNAIRENNTFNNSGPETEGGWRGGGRWVEGKRLKVPQNGSFSSCYALLKLYRTPPPLGLSQSFFSFSLPLPPKARELTNNSKLHL